MDASAPARLCTHCGARLAADNREAVCRPCQRAGSDARANPPKVPAEFWDNELLRDALVRDRHMGHAVRVYRKHSYHGGRGISQEVAARWLSISQAQLARIERGKPIYDLDRLIQWARKLQIPPELLWFSLPADGESEDVNRRSFLLAGGATAASAGLLPAPVPAGAANSGNTLDADACSQWLAWELWNRSAQVINAEEVPLDIRRSLAALPPAGTLILRDQQNNYSFAHPSLIDFFVAQRIFGELAQGNSGLMTTSQTSHDTDQVIRRFVQHDNTCVPILGQWMRDGGTPVLRVNSAGILAKLGDADIADQVITILRQDDDTRNLYLTAVASRVLSLPWEQAGSLARGSLDLTSQSAMSSDRAAEYAVQLSQEMRNSQDGAARWCSVVLLSRIAQPVPARVTNALQEALRGEECRENLRAIASALSDADPLQT